MPVDRARRILDALSTTTVHSHSRWPAEIPDVGRDDLPALFRMLGFREGAEIGVAAGAYSEQIVRGCPGLRLWCVDRWTAYADDPQRVSQAEMHARYDRAFDRLRGFNVRFLTTSSRSAATSFQDRALDFVYIDADHRLAAVVADLTAWVPKVRPGGIIAGHDFCRRTNPAYGVHVVEAVTAYTTAYNIKPWFVLGRKAIVSGEVRDRPRSFLWIR